MDRFTSILLVAGLGFFALAFVLSGLYPYAITDAREPITTIAELAKQVSTEFKDLKEKYPVSFAELPQAAECRTDYELQGATPEERTASDRAWEAAYAVALRNGRDRYIGEACWHCHSQFVRPAANEAARYGPVRGPEVDNNELQRPMLWGTRRVGPDLTHEGGKRSNDWHVAHLLDPSSTSPGSIMPRYVWLFRDGYQLRRRVAPDTADQADIDTDTSYALPGLYEQESDATAALATARAALPDSLRDESERMFVAPANGPTTEALSLIAYLQWLGTWEPADKGGAE